MKRLYVVRVEIGNNIDAWHYNVVAANGQEAGKKAVRQASIDSGRKTGWRLVSLLEKPELVIS